MNFEYWFYWDATEITLYYLPTMNEYFNSDMRMSHVMEGKLKCKQELKRHVLDHTSTKVVIDSIHKGTAGDSHIWSISSDIKIHSALSIAWIDQDREILMEQVMTRGEDKSPFNVKDALKKLINSKDIDQDIAKALKKNLEEL